VVLAYVCFTGLVVSEAVFNESQDSSRCVPGPDSSSSVPSPDSTSLVPSPDSTEGVRSSVLAIRHGLTQWNADQRWQGWADIPLSPTGERQAEVGAKSLAGLLAEDGRRVRIVASDLVRARQTAEFFAVELGIGLGEILTRSGLRERNVGAWSGKTGREIEQRWPGMLQAWRDGTITETPEGENEDGFQARIGEVLAEFAHDSASAEDVVILVTHGGVIRTFERMVGLEPEPVGNVSGRWFGLAGPRNDKSRPTPPTMSSVQGFHGVDLLSDDLLARFKAGGGEPIERTAGNAL
jgi:broad specificity phosphatase PhoE